MRTRSHSISAASVSIVPVVSIVRAATEEKTQLSSDTSDESDEGEYEHERLYVYLGDNEWMLRSDYEEHDEDDEDDEDDRVGFGDDFGDGDVTG
jgi:hypothetical protein